MRIVSLDPAWTEWVAAFGALQDLVGRSHVCDFPASVRSLPAVTEPPQAQPLPGPRWKVAAEGAPNVNRRHVLDVDRLASLEPDIILTSSRNGVSTEDLEHALTDQTGSPPACFAACPSTLKEVLDAALRLGAAIGRSSEAMAYIGEKEIRIREQRLKLGLNRRGPTNSHLPTVVCIASIDPLTTAGLWAPDMVELAGGRPLAATRGEPPRSISWSTVQEANPDVLAVLTCGDVFDAVRVQLEKLADDPKWRHLEAVRGGRIVALDGDTYCARPGPRLYRGIELLTSALYPDKVQFDVHASEMAAIRI